MKKRFVMLLVLAGCGPEQRGPAFPVELYVTAGLLDDLSAFQISLVTKGTSLDCVRCDRHE